MITPFYPLTTDRKDDLECCDDQGFNNRTSFCYSCGKHKHVLPLTEKQSWSCCKEKEIYKNEESKCCEYGVEKGQQCKSNVCFNTTHLYHNPKSLFIRIRVEVEDMVLS